MRLPDAPVERIAAGGRVWRPPGAALGGSARRASELLARARVCHNETLRAVMENVFCKRDYGWTPFLWLFYLLFFFLHPILDKVSLREWIFTLLGTAVFVALYFTMFRTRSRGWQWFAIIVTLLLGMGFAPINPGASTFFIYAASFIPFVTGHRRAIQLLLALLVVAAVEAWLLHLPAVFSITVFLIAIPVGASNIFFAQRNRANEKLRQAREEVEHLAKVAERERIARDLHDVLGHTLSMIILKSELAGKLMARDPGRARQEIGEVEQAARDALAEVRATIRGYRASSLEVELKQARTTLETAGVEVEAISRKVPLTPAQEGVVAMIVREAVTNVVRHANARHCRLELIPAGANCQLVIADDGQGGDQVEGNGLRGMRERVEALGGTLDRETRSGTRLKVIFPLAGTEPRGNS
jgi:two-component system sensor histidine kinase DesK